MVSSSCSTTMHRVAEVAQTPERLEQAVVVPLVQADARLVEDVEHSDQPRADLGGQPDPLGLAAGEGARRAAQGQVVEADVAQEAEPVAHFLEDRAGHSASSPRPCRRPRTGSPSKNSTARATGRSTTSPMLSPPTSTARLSGWSRLPPQAATGHLDHEFLERDAHGVAGALAVPPLDVLEDALPLVS